MTHPVGTEQKINPTDAALIATAGHRIAVSLNDPWGVMKRLCEFAVGRHEIERAELFCRQLSRMHTPYSDRFDAIAECETRLSELLKIDFWQRRKDDAREIEKAEIERRIAGLKSSDKNARETMMVPRAATLTSRDRLNMNSFLGHVLEDFRAGVISKEHAVLRLANVVDAIDAGNYGEAISWFEKGRRLVRSSGELLARRFGES